MANIDDARLAEIRRVAEEENWRYGDEPQRAAAVALDDLRTAHDEVAALQERVREAERRLREDVAELDRRLSKAYEERNAAEAEVAALREKMERAIGAIGKCDGICGEVYEALARNEPVRKA